MMEYQIFNEQGNTWIEGVPGQTQIGNEQELLDFIMLHGEFERDEDEWAWSRILLYDADLPVSFFDLRTRVAGGFLQKLINYRVKAAFVVDKERIQGRFGEMVLESQRSSQARFFTTRAGCGVAGGVSEPASYSHLPNSIARDNPLTDIEVRGFGHERSVFPWSGSHPRAGTERGRISASDDVWK
ncbi:MAG: DUF4180 domain-containing protein [Anaerolineales bacterium]|nr:DUF4180 domain-containing protein [Anaerolineales bacterium]